MGSALDTSIDAVARSIARSSPDNIILLDTDANIRFLNYTLPHLRMEQVIGSSLFRHVPEEYHAEMRRCFAQVRRSGMAGRYETAYVADNGEVSYWESRVGPIIPRDEVEGFVVLSSNVSERRKAAADRDRFFNLSLDMLCVASYEGYFLRINPAFERTLGYEDGELLATPFVEFVHPDDRQTTNEAVARLAGGESVIDFENRYRRRDGEYRWLSWRAGADPTQRRIHAVARDITERRQLEAQLQHAQKLDAVGQLAGGIAHDFSNLVQAIQINAELAERRAGQARAGDHIKQIRDAAQHAADLTRQLLAVSRRQPTRPAPLDLRSLVDGLFDLLRRLIPESIRISIEAPQEPCIARADRAQLEQVLLNLCLNARDAMAEGGELGIAVRAAHLDDVFCQAHPWARPGSYSVLRVSDTGHGIDASVRDHVFEPFFSTKAPGRGSGLGLATTYGIVRQHGGLVRFESPPQRGTTFEVYLPAGARNELRPHRPSEPPSFAHALEGRGETILVAEDDAMVRRAVVQLLEEAGYRVIAAVDGEQAVDLFERHERDVRLLLLDIVMPGLGGPEALERIRRRAPHARAVICSGYDNALAARPIPGTVQIVKKPYQGATLLRRIRSELDR